MYPYAKPFNQRERELRELRIEIPEDLRSLLLKPASWPQCCIYRVPRKLRETNEPAYTPHIISIGPFHCRKEKLEAMKSHKLRYLAEFCHRTGKELGEIRGWVEERKLDIQYRYEEPFETWNDELVKMIVLDSVFIIELFLRSSQPDLYENDFILAKPWLRDAIMQDLILLENQLPYFLLEDLFNFAVPKSKDRQYSFFELTCICFHRYIDNPRAKEEEQDLQKTKPFQLRKGTCNETGEEFHKRLYESPRLAKEFQKEKHHHFLDIIRKFLISNHPKPRIGSGFKKNQYTATKLSGVGVKFQVDVDPDACPLHADFKDGVLKMPRFIAEDSTETMVRNLMAFEQCHHPKEAYLCYYFLLLDSLINNEDDVDVLIQNGVIINKLGYERAVSNMVNSLCKQIACTEFCYNHVSIGLDKRYNNRFLRRLAILKSVYFSNLWRGTGTVAAVVLLLLTFIQTVYSVM